ncbi:MAG TPA: hypothetical protein QF871_00595, partial [SAR324 cluster bacterium]|nr:hypothetical protein [SAR324 cluster bacterium]
MGLFVVSLNRSNELAGSNISSSTTHYDTLGYNFLKFCPDYFKELIERLKMSFNKSGDSSANP